MAILYLECAVKVNSFSCEDVEMFRFIKNSTRPTGEEITTFIKEKKEKTKETRISNCSPGQMTIFPPRVDDFQTDYVH